MIWNLGLELGIELDMKIEILMEIYHDYIFGMGNIFGRAKYVCISIGLLVSTHMMHHTDPIIKEHH